MSRPLERPPPEKAKARRALPGATEPIIDNNSDGTTDSTICPAAPASGGSIVVVDILSPETAVALIDADPGFAGAVARWIRLSMTCASCGGRLAAGDVPSLWLRMRRSSGPVLLVGVCDCCAMRPDTALIHAVAALGRCRGASIRAILDPAYVLPTGGRA